MSPLIVNSAKSVRSKYAYLFESISELYRFRYGEKPSTKFDQVQSETEQLFDDGYLNEYLHENIKSLFDLYPTMIPGKHNPQEKLDKLSSLLDMIIGDICLEIKTVSDYQQEHDFEMLLKELQQQ